MQATRLLIEGEEEEKNQEENAKSPSSHIMRRRTANGLGRKDGCWSENKVMACCFWTLNSLSRNKNPLPMFHMLLGDISAFSSTNARCTPYTVSEIRKISCWWRFTFRMAGQLVVRYPQSRTNHTRRHILAFDGLCFPSATIKFFLSCTPYKNMEYGVPRSSPVR